MSTKDLAFYTDGDYEDDIELRLYVVPLKSYPTPMLDPWRTSFMTAKKSFVVNVKWNGQLAFSSPQGSVTPSREIPGETRVIIEAGQETTLSKQVPGSPTCCFTSPVSISDLTVARAVNETGLPVRISLGYITDFNTPEEMVHPKITTPTPLGHGMYASGNLQPVIRAYVVVKPEGRSSYSIGSAKPIWEADILSLDDKTTINISQDKITRGFVGEKGAGKIAIEPSLVDTPSPPTNKSHKKVDHRQGEDPAQADPPPGIPVLSTGPKDSKDGALGSNPNGTNKDDSKPAPGKK
ncbi:hypothetical protein VTO73DRAFT_6728 [Trametes versicolor]